MLLEKHIANFDRRELSRKLNRIQREKEEKKNWKWWNNVDLLIIVTLKFYSIYLKMYETMDDERLDLSLSPSTFLSVTVKYRGRR